MSHEKCFGEFAGPTSTGGYGWKRDIPDLPGMWVMLRLESSHSRPKVATPDTAGISALPLAGRRAEEYPVS
jgi:hypothetical protein